MAMISSSRSHSYVLLLRCRRLFSSSSASPSLPPPSPGSISVSAAKTWIRKEFDPDKALSILSSVSNPAASPVSGRYAVDLTVRRLARCRRFAEIESLIESRKNGPYASQEAFLATLILTYGGGGMLDHAVRTFEEVATLCSAPPTAVSFNALLLACIRAKKPRRVPHLFSELPTKHSVDPDVVSYGILIKSLCLSSNSKKAFETLKEMEEKKIDVTTPIYTTLLDTLYKEGKPEEAEKLWKEIPSKGCVPDLAAYNVRVMYRALHGKADEVLDVIGEIESAGLKPDTITFNYLITSYCKHGRIEEAKEVYKGLKFTNAATFRNFLFFLCENGDLDAGLEVFMDSVKKNKIPEFRTLSLLVEGLVKASKAEEAKAVIDVVKKKFPVNLLGGWKMLEKKLGLNVDEEVAALVEAT